MTDPLPPLSQLRQVCAKATQGEWSVRPGDSIVRVDAEQTGHAETCSMNVSYLPVAECAFRDRTTVVNEREKENARFIATFDPVLVARLLAVVQAQRKIVEESAAHARECILGAWQQGEPTPHGGYRCKYRGVWYEFRPVNRCPPCDCGLQRKLEALARLSDGMLDA